jgi:hypothetical protein
MPVPECHIIVHPKNAVTNPATGTNTGKSADIMRSLGKVHLVI